LENESISHAAARGLRGGVMPHVPPAAAPVSTSVRLELEAAKHAFPEVLITDPRREHGWRVALQRAADSNFWHTEILLPREPTVLRYRFVLDDGTIMRERRQIEGTARPVYGLWEEHDFQLSVYDPKGSPPGWVQGSVMYQIFPDRFARGNSDSEGQGADSFTRGSVHGRQALYLEWGEKPERPPKSRDFFRGNLRGVIEKLDYISELGITCIYFTPIFESPSNHRYDAIDYMKIDPMLGTEEDLRELIEKANERGMRVLLDGVFNHCSDESVYMKAARADKSSPYYRWFNFTDWPDNWVGWLNVKTMPEFVECPEMEEFFFGEEGVALHWLGYGTAGWRTDVTPWLTDEFWRRFRRAVRGAYPEAYLVSEDWGNSSPRLVGDTFDATMNYRFGYSVNGFAGGELSASELDDRLETLRRDTPEPNLHVQMNLLDSHDTARILTVLGGSRERVMLATALQLAYPGVPMIYYGDEAGLEGDFAEDGRRPYPWGSADKELLDFYRRAINLRRGSKALSGGDVSTAWIDDRGGYGFMRRSEEDIVVALFNNGSEPLEATIPLREEASGEWQDLLGNVPAPRTEDGTLFATIPPLGAAWLQQRSNHRASELRTVLRMPALDANRSPSKD
jgi:glycosidase